MTLIDRYLRAVRDHLPREVLGSWVVMADSVLPTGDQANLMATINAVVRISIAATIVLTVITAALEVRRLVRMGRA